MERWHSMTARQVMEKLGSGPEGLSDGEAARRAGTHFCAVLNGTTTFEEFQTRRIPCDHVAGDLWDLKQWLGLN